MFVGAQHGVERSQFQQQLARMHPEILFYSAVGSAGCWLC